MTHLISLIKILLHLCINDKKIKENNEKVFGELKFPKNRLKTGLKSSFCQIIPP